MSLTRKILPALALAVALSPLAAQAQSAPQTLRVSPIAPNICGGKGRRFFPSYVLVNRAMRVDAAEVFKAFLAMEMQGLLMRGIFEGVKTEDDHAIEWCERRILQRRGSSSARTSSSFFSLSILS